MQENANSIFTKTYCIYIINTEVSIMTIEEVWNKIQKHEGETFSTKTGIRFSFLIKNERIYIVGYEKTRDF